MCVCIYERLYNSITRKLYFYDKADFDGLRSSQLSHVPWGLFISSDDIDSSIVFFPEQSACCRCTAHPNNEAKTKRLDHPGLIRCDEVSQEKESPIA